MRASSPPPRSASSKSSVSDRLRSTTLETGRSLVFVDDVSLQRGEQKRTEPPAGRLGGTDVMTFQEPRKEALRQILRILSLVAVSPQICVERRPVRLAQFGQGSTGLASSGHPPRSPGSIASSRTRRRPAAWSQGLFKRAQEFECVFRTGRLLGRQGRAQECAHRSGERRCSRCVAGIKGLAIVKRDRPTERMTPRQHLVRDDSQRPDVPCWTTTSPAACSGAMYSRVPTSSPVSVPFARSIGHLGARTLWPARSRAPWARTPPSPAAAKRYSLVSSHDGPGPAGVRRRPQRRHPRKM